MKLTGNTILITGGTSGIGRALAEQFHNRGNRVVIAGRRQALLDAVTAAHPGMEGIRLDVQDQTAIKAFVAELEERFPALNVLINNAGVTRTEDLAAEAIDVSVSREIINTNVIGVLELTAALLPTLKRQPAATFITTTSGLAFVPRANYPTYCATKAFLHSWLQSLRHQLRNTTVEVLELAPPYVQTELGGPSQATDPAAMPLADYAAEVMQLLDGSSQPRGELLVERVKALRWAEQKGTYQQAFDGMNGK